MKRNALAAVLIVLLVVAAFILRNRDRTPGMPEETINALFDAAERGEDRAYLQLLADPLREQMVQIRAELGAERYRGQLRRSMADMQGYATERIDSGPDGAITIRVEMVFTDRNEVQQYTLVPHGSGWLVTAITTAEATRPDIPYGTPVFEQGPAEE